MKQRLDNLRTTIAHHNHQYHVLGAPEISDSVYDRMFRTLIDLEREYPEYYDPNSPTSRIGSDLRNDFNTVDHLSPMLSVDAVQTLREIEQFSAGFDTICELKYDGAGVNLIYKDGVLFKAITRGDGFKGMDVTENIRTISQIPYTINTTETVEIRGEVWCSWSELKRLKSLGENVKSPVAVAINTIKTKQSATCAKRNLTFTAFHVIPSLGGAGVVPGIDSHIETLHWLQSNQFNIPYVLSLAKAMHVVEREFCQANELPGLKDVAADGIIFKHNDLSTCESEGHNSRSVNWAISWKFDKDLYPATIAGIGGKVAANGRITHLAFINPITINGETITKIVCPVEIINRIEIGSTVSVRRKGTRVAQIILSPDVLNSPPLPALDWIGTGWTGSYCPQCGSRLVSHHNHWYCPDVCADQIARASSSFYASLVTQAESYSIDSALYQYIVNDNNCRLYPVAPKSNKYNLYYNSPAQLASIGFAIGKYSKGNPA